MFIGGAGGKTYYYDRDTSIHGILPYRDVIKADAVNTRSAAHGFYRWGMEVGNDVRWDRDYYIAILEGAFLPPVSGFYTLVKYTDDQGMIWFNMNGTNIRDNQEMLLETRYRGWIPDRGPEHVEARTEKMYLEAGFPYAFEDYFYEHGGHAWGSFGYIFHGQNRGSNMEHTPVKEVVNEDWDESHYRMQVVKEKQRHEISSDRRNEKHRIRLTTGSDTADTVRFSLNWSNSNGQNKSTPFGTFNEFRQNSGNRIKTLLDSQCQTSGAMTVVARLDAETHGWPGGMTTQESFCGARSIYARWRHLFEHGRNGFVQQNIIDIPNMCMAQFGTVDERAELRMLVGWMRNGSDVTFETLQESMEFEWFSWKVEDYIPQVQTSNSWSHFCIDIKTLVDGLAEQIAEDENPDYAGMVYVKHIYTAHDWGFLDDIELGEADEDYMIDRIKARV